MSKESREKAVREEAIQYVNDATKKLIAQANYDLYYGPHDEDDYPGFSKAIKLITKGLEDVSELWVDSDSECVCDVEPEWNDEGGEPQECPENWLLYSRHDVIKTIVGTELVGFVV